MNSVRRRAVTVLAGLLAGALAVALDAAATVVVASAALYAGAAYYASKHPDAVWGRDRSGPDWTAGVLGGGMSLGVMGLVGADVAPGVALLGFGLVLFGFATGVAYGRE